jgi:tetratricopeptide (TPR) repeat protein
MLSIAEKQLPFHIRRATGTLALVHVEMGDMETATELINQLDYDIDSYQLNIFLMVEKAVGLYLLYQEAYSDLLNLTAKIVESLEENGLVCLMPHFYFLQARAFMGLGKSEEARKILRQGLNTAREIKGRRGILKLAGLLVELEEMAGNETAVKQLQTEIEATQANLDWI